MGLLDQEGKKRVREAVERAESRTAGEIVVATAARSDSYAGPRAFAALCLTVGLALEAFWELHAVPPWIVFLGQIPLGLAVYYGLGFPPLLRLLVPRGRFDEAVDNHAKRAFLDLGVCETRDRSGVLVLVSELEHRVEILADRGIHERVEPGEWQADVDALLEALRAGEAAEGLVRVVDRIGGLLAEHFPRRSDDVNELPDEVREL